MRSRTHIIISALYKLSDAIQTDDGVVNACLFEAAFRMEELRDAGNAMRDAIQDLPQCGEECGICRICRAEEVAAKAAEDWCDVSK